MKEILKQILIDLEESVSHYGSDSALRDGIEKLRNLIAELEKAEPMAWYSPTSHAGSGGIWSYRTDEGDMPLYLHPPLDTHDWKKEYLEAVRLHNLTLDELRVAHQTINKMLQERAEAGAKMEFDHGKLVEGVTETDLNTCPNCGGPADNGHNREYPPSPYFCTKCMAAEDASYLLPTEPTRQESQVDPRHKPTDTAVNPDAVGLEPIGYIQVWEDGSHQLFLGEWYPSAAAPIYSHDQVQKLQEEIAHLQAQDMRFSMREPTALRSQLNAATEEIARLKQVCRNVYEVWAESEGILKPDTCAESYLLRLIENMKDIAKEGLR